MASEVQQNSEGVEEMRGPVASCNSEATLIKDGRNSKLVVCQKCNSQILRPHMGEYIEEEHFIPHMKKKSNSEDMSAGETLHQFWLVNDIYTFENVGFTNTVENTKYLTCADCEIGPIGVHNLSTKKSYVALDRVNHE